MNFAMVVAAMAGLLAGQPVRRRHVDDEARPRRASIVPAGRCWRGDGVPSKVRTKAQRNKDRAERRPGYIVQGGGQGRVR